MTWADSALSVEEGLLRQMRDTMGHRGPDGAGVWVSPDGRIGLAHRRLSIIDLSAQANQPMFTADGRYALVFNGEIYNHAQLRKELEELGRGPWLTDHSDSEVVLHAFAQWGIQCLHRFEGMFAICLWDRKERHLWLIRDRMGIKPLYYSLQAGKLTFASEIKAILADPQQPRRLNEEALFHYLGFLCVPSPQTMFEGIHKLASGCWIRFDARGGSRAKRWYEPWRQVTPNPSISQAEAAEAIITRLRQAVKLRKVADVPMGVFLSGGIDSNANLALFAQGETQVNTFSIGYVNESPSAPSELGQAAEAAAWHKAKHHERRLSREDLLRVMPLLAQGQDEPLADPVCVPFYYLSQLARDGGVVVCQVGEGADELFWGYPRWKVMRRLQNLASLPVPRAVRQLAWRALEAGGRGDWLGSEFLRRSARGLPLFWGGSDQMSEAGKWRLLAPPLRKRLSGLSSWDAVQPIWQRFQDNAWEQGPLQWMSYMDLNLRLPDLLLMRVDKMSMAWSLECRVPFLDHKLVELVLGLPEELKTKNGRLKNLLKEAVKGIIPDQVINRPKRGFWVPLDTWFVEGLGQEIQRELSGFCDEHGVFDKETVTRLAQGKDPRILWLLYNFTLWYRAYCS